MASGYERLKHDLLGTLRDRTDGRLAYQGLKNLTRTRELELEAEKGQLSRAENVLQQQAQLLSQQEQELRGRLFQQERESAKIKEDRMAANRVVEQAKAEQHLARERLAEAEAEQHRACARLVEMRRQQQVLRNQLSAGCSARLFRSLSSEVSDLDAVKELFARRQRQAIDGCARLSIQSIVKVENLETLSRFQSSGSFRINPIEAHRAKCDTLLFHGCPDAVAANIQAIGLSLQHAGNGMLGRGIYGAPDPRKSLGYSRSTDKFMFICRFNLFSSQHAGPDTRHPNHSFHEFCVYDERHVVVLWMIKLSPRVGYCL